MSTKNSNKKPFYGHQANSGECEHPNFLVMTLVRQSVKILAKKREISLF